MTDLIIQAGDTDKRFRAKDKLPIKGVNGSIIEGQDIRGKIKVNGTSYNVLISHYLRRVAPQGGFTNEHSANVLIYEKDGLPFISEHTIMPGDSREDILNNITFKISHER